MNDFPTLALSISPTFLFAKFQTSNAGAPRRSLGSETGREGLGFFAFKFFWDFLQDTTTSAHIDELIHVLFLLLATVVRALVIFLTTVEHDLTNGRPFLVQSSS